MLRLTIWFKFCVVSVLDPPPPPLPKAGAPDAPDPEAMLSLARTDLGPSFRR